MKERQMASANEQQQQQKPRSKTVCILFLLIAFICFYTPWIYWCTLPENIRPCLSVESRYQAIQSKQETYNGDLRDMKTRWNNLEYGDISHKYHPRLKIALFVKKWPSKSSAGGLERHARTVHRELANRGHEIHVFTSHPTDPLEETNIKNFLFHFSAPTPRGNLNPVASWKQFKAANNSLENGFDILHTESVALPHNRAKGLAPVIASWHGIEYETIHSDIVQDLARSPGEARSRDLQMYITERVQRVIDEVNFFPHYAHHVATSDSVGEVLKTVYMLPTRAVHVIVNGVDEDLYKPDEHVGVSFRGRHGIPGDAKLVIGIAGRLVKDKGHPLVYDVLNSLLKRKSFSRVYVLVAGDGPWGGRYKELAPAVKVLGSLNGKQLGEFYNAIDVFLNPTLRAQGLDHTLIEAMLSGTPLMASRFSSILQSVVTGPEYGYTFSPTVESLKEALKRAVEDGKDALSAKGRACRERASELFTANKMASAYERLFMCVALGNRTGVDFCKYPIADFDVSKRSGPYLHRL